MAQSSNYKQYSRGTRVLTEESGFAGGMLWTGNNIDETHLKAIVNCDYDDTTGYLKARDPFTPTSDSPSVEQLEGVNVNLSGYKLLCTHYVCAFDSEDETTLDAGWLYIFTNTQVSSSNITCSVDKFICIYSTLGRYQVCELDVDEDVTLRNINTSNVLLNYDNQLYGLGSYPNIEDAWLCVYRIERTETVVNGVSTYTFKFKQRGYTDYVKPRIDEVGLLEACTTGFNAARGKSIFTYGNIDISEGEQPYIAGVYFKDAYDNVVVSPSVGQDVTVCVPVARVKDGTEHYLAMFQAKEISESSTQLEEPWDLVKTETANDDGIFEFKYKVPRLKTELYFTYYGKTDPEAGGETATAYSDAAVNQYMFVVTANNNTDNLKLKPYDLNGVYGSCLWKNRMCIWGVQNSSNSLFLSEVDNFYYYPVPHNVALFDTNVVSCIPYKDTLLVFTADKIYRVSENNDGTFTQTVVQNDMPLKKDDSAHLTAVKNMVLFKSGNYFYMIVPKSQSLTDELSIAPIYKNVAGFLNTLDKSVLEVLQLMYPEYVFNSCNVSKTPTNVYSEQDSVHILYDVETNISFKNTNAQTAVSGLLRKFKLFLIYNTNLRAWHLYIEDTTEASLEVAALTPERLMSFIRVYRTSNKYLFDVVTRHSEDKNSSGFRLLLDSGYRTLSSALQKRFREVQLKIHHEKESTTAFGTAFLVDGVWRRNYSKLQETVLNDNLVSLMPVMDLNTFVTELSMPVDETGRVVKSPGSDAIELNSWTLDFSHFKREAPTTVRIPVSGKGYSPRFIFMAPEATGLTINEINWVYRLMYGR